MKSFWSILLLLLPYLRNELAHAVVTGEATQTYHSNQSSGTTIQQLADKIFPVFSDLAGDSVLFSLIQNDSVLESRHHIYMSRIAHCLDTCTSAYSIAQELKWKENEIDLVEKRLQILFKKTTTKSRFMCRLKKGRACIAYKNNSGSDLLKQAWVEAARGMNRIYDVYIAGVLPTYAAIDSIRIDVSSETGFRRLRDSIQRMLVRQDKDEVFYTLPLSLSIKALQLSGRDEAIRYEPIKDGINKVSYNQVSNTRFSDYSYSAILVPGFGPDEPGLNIDPRSIKRCEMAVELFRKKLAPFIIVSGGHVYPAGTPFSEAVEMKKYLISHYDIPPQAIITEPYARHTTTNVRNASRLIYLFGLPSNKPVIVSTDSVQTQMVVNLAGRCKRELGYVPFRKMMQLNTTTSSFYPVEEAFQVNVNDPLDP